jgi:predicted RNase H-like HicB family nuclease
MKQYLVIYEQADDGGWGAHSPDVEGVFALGGTRAEVEERMSEALAAHLDYLRERVPRFRNRTPTPAASRREPSRRLAAVTT